MQQLRFSRRLPRAINIYVRYFSISYKSYKYSYGIQSKSWAGIERVTRQAISKLKWSGGEEEVKEEEQKEQEKEQWKEAEKNREREKEVDCLW